MLASRTSLLRAVAVAAALWTSGADRPGRISAASQTTGTLSGTVVDAADGVPVPFAAVELRSGASLGVAGQRYSARADETGRFSISGIAPQQYFLAGFKPGYPPSFHAARGWTTTAPGDRINVGAGQPDVPIEIRLARGGVITGRVTDPFGQPVAGAQLHIRRLPQIVPPQSPFYFNSAHGSTSTTATGEFRLYALPEGEYIIGAATSDSEFRLGSTNGPPVTVSKVFYSGATDMSQARPVSVRAGTETSGIDIQLRFAGLYSVSGRVDVPKGTNVQMALWLQPGNEYQSISYANLTGTFQQDRLVAGRYRLTAYSRGTSAPGDPAAPLTWTWMDLAITDRNLTDIVVSLQPSMTASGRFLTDAPLPGARARVVFQTAARPVIDATPRPGLIGPDGQFVVNDLIPGTYTIAVYSDNNTLTPVTATFNGQPLANNQIEISAGTNVTGLEIRVRR